MNKGKCNLSGISFLKFLKLKNFRKITLDVPVNMFGLKQEKKEKIIIIVVFPLKVVDEEKSDDYDLLLISDDNKSHFNYI